MDDIRREYTLVLSRLQLCPEFPELVRSSTSGFRSYTLTGRTLTPARADVNLDPESVVALFSQTGEFDSAFSAALVLDVDMSSLFETLAAKCVTLGLNGAM